MQILIENTSMLIAVVFLRGLNAFGAVRLFLSSTTYLEDKTGLPGYLWHPFVNHFLSETFLAHPIWTNVFGHIS